MEKKEKEDLTEKSMATEDEISKIIRNHIMGSMGVGLIPLPLLDLAALTGIQLNMLRRLADSYNIPFSKDKGKNVLASLMGAGISLPIATTLASLVKAIPIIGQAAGALSLPATAGASTYAVARVFTQHFESGGTFLDLDPEKVKAYYFEMLKEGEKIAAELKEQEKQAEEKAVAADSDEKADEEIITADASQKQENALADEIEKPEEAVTATAAPADSGKKAEDTLTPAVVQKDETKNEAAQAEDSILSGGTDGNEAEESTASDADDSSENEETAGVFRPKRGKKAKKKW